MCSVVLSSKNNITSRKSRLCCFCEERINIGDKYDIRNGIGEGVFISMKMHPECHAYEMSSDKPVNMDWYECPDGPAFEHKQAIAYVLDVGINHILRERS